MKTTRHPKKILNRLLLLGTASLLVACQSLPAAQSESPTNPLHNKTPSQPAKNLKTFYQQKLNWQTCAKPEFECAKIKVPLDYQHPNGPKLTLAINRKPNPKAIGHLIINPGGPGASGIKFLEESAAYYPKALTAAYQLVSFDPRGVGNSSPLNCLNDKEKDQQRSADINLDTETHRQTALPKVAAFYQKCLKNTPYGEGIKYLNTENVAKDLDIIRAVLGDQKLSYQGYSYGTQIGLSYLRQFPNQVGRMVLDGVINPKNSEQEIANLQAIGFEKAYQHFAQYCQQSDNHCPFHNVAAAKQQLLQLFQQLENHPLPTNQAHRPLTRSLAEAGVVGALYNEASYPLLAAALNEAMTEKRGDKLLKMADENVNRNPAGKYTDNSYDAQIVINSLDYPTEPGTPEQWQTEGDQLTKTAPRFGPILAYGGFLKNTCPFCQTVGKQTTTAKSTTKDKTQKFPTTVPILIINPLHDPATPVEMAQQVHKNLPNSRLITVDTYNHTAFLLGSSCVQTPVLKYLLVGKPPQKDIKCSQ